MKKIQVYLPEEMLAALEVRSKESMAPVSALIRRAVEGLLAVSDGPHAPALRCDLCGRVRDGFGRSCSTCAGKLALSPASENATMVFGLAESADHPGTRVPPADRFPDVFVEIPEAELLEKMREAKKTTVFHPPVKERCPRCRREERVNGRLPEKCEVCDG